MKINANDSYEIYSIASILNNYLFLCVLLLLYWYEQMYH